MKSPQKSASRALVRALVIDWQKVEAGLGDVGTQTSREMRMAYASRILRRPIASFNDLSMDEGLKLLSAFKEELGEEFKGSARRPPRRNTQSGERPKVSGSVLVRIGEMAAELWNGPDEDWGESLRARVMERFSAASPMLMTPHEGAWLVDELLQRIAVRNIADRHQPPIPRREIEEEKEILRSRFFPSTQNTEVASDAAV